MPSSFSNLGRKLSIFTLDPVEGRGVGARTNQVQKLQVPIIRARIVGISAVAASSLKCVRQFEAPGSEDKITPPIWVSVSDEEMDGQERETHKYNLSPTSTFFIK